MAEKGSFTSNIVDIIVIAFSFISFIYIGFILWMMAFDFFGCISNTPTQNPICGILKQSVHYLVALVACTGTGMMLYERIKII